MCHHVRGNCHLHNSDSINNRLVHLHELYFFTRGQLLKAIFNATSQKRYGCLVVPSLVIPSRIAGFGSLLTSPLRFFQHINSQAIYTY
jgi:hypothetical protein